MTALWDADRETIRALWGLGGPVGRVPSAGKSPDSNASVAGDSSPGNIFRRFAGSFPSNGTTLSSDG